MAESSGVSTRSDTAAIQGSRQYYFAILPRGDVYHIAHDGDTLCSIDLHGKDRWFRRGSEQLIPASLRLCRRCDAAFHRELALSKAHIREEIAAIAGIDRRASGTFTKRELADLLAALRRLTGE